MTGVQGAIGCHYCVTGMSQQGPRKFIWNAVGVSSGVSMECHHGVKAVS